MHRNADRPARESAPPGTQAIRDFVDRESESRRVHEAIRNRQNLVICGPAGIGKTALVSKVISDLLQEQRKRCLYIPGVKDLQDLLRQLIRALYNAKDPALRQQLHTQGVSSLTFDGWLKTLPSSRLRGALYSSIEQGAYHVFLDHLPSLTQAAARVIKEMFWMRNTPVCLLPRAGTEYTVDRFNHFFYWSNQERVVLGPLPTPAALDLMESSIKRFGLTQFELADFREQVLDLSKQVPGAIVRMCALAADPRYHYQSRIKIKSVYIDYLMSGSSSQAPGATSKFGDKPRRDSSWTSWCG